MTTPKQELQAAIISTKAARREAIATLTQSNNPNNRTNYLQVVETLRSLNQIWHDESFSME